MGGACASKQASSASASSASSASSSRQPHMAANNVSSERRVSLNKTVKPQPRRGLLGLRSVGRAVMRLTLGRMQHTAQNRISPYDTSSPPASPVSTAISNAPRQLRENAADIPPSSSAAAALPPPQSPSRAPSKVVLPPLEPSKLKPHLKKISSEVSNKPAIPSADIKRTSSNPVSPRPNDGPPFPREGISANWLKSFVKSNRAQLFSWVSNEYLKPEHGGGGEVQGTADTLDTHRDRIAAAAADGDGKPVTVSYTQIPFENMTTDNVCFAIVKPETEERRCSYTEFLEMEPGSPHGAHVTRQGGRGWVAPATMFISHAWRYRFLDVADVIIDMIDEMDDASSVYVWFDVFTVNQHQTTVVQPSWWYTTFKEAVGAIGHTVLILLPCLDPVPLTRAWCIWEILSTIDGGALLDIRLPKEEQLRFITFLVEHGTEQVVNALVKIDVNRAEAWNHNDRDNILNAVREYPGGASGVNKKIKDSIREWICKSTEIGLDLVSAADRPTSKLLMDCTSLMQEMGRYEAAEPLLVEALAGRRAAFGESHPNTLACMNNLANTYTGQGKYDLAIHMYHLCLRRLDESSSDLAKDVRVTMLKSANNLASVILERYSHRADEAEDLLNLALSGLKREVGREDPATLSAMNNLATLMQGKGPSHFAQAESLYQEALEIYRETVGENHPSCLNVMNNLGNLLKSDGYLEDAEVLLRKSMTGRRRELGDKHPDTLTSMNNLAVLLKDLKKFDEALPLYREALESKLSEIGSEHPTTLTTMNNLAVLLLRLGQFEEAEQLAVQTLEGRRRVLGNDHPDTISTMQTAATLMKSVGKVNETMELYKELMDCRKKLDGEKSEKYGDVLHSFAIFLKSIDRYADAQAKFTESADIYAIVLGQNSDKATRARESASIMEEALAGTN